MLNEYGPGKIESRACKYSTLFLLCSYCINASIKLKIYSKRLTVVNAKWHDTIIVIFFHFLNGLRPTDMTESHMSPPHQGQRQGNVGTCYLKINSNKSNSFIFIFCCNRQLRTHPPLRGKQQSRQCQRASIRKELGPTIKEELLQESMHQREMHCLWGGSRLD